MENIKNFLLQSYNGTVCKITRKGSSNSVKSRINTGPQERGSTINIEIAYATKLNITRNCCSASFHFIHVNKSQNSMITHIIKNMKDITDRKTDTMQLHKDQFVQLLIYKFRLHVIQMIIFIEGQPIKALSKSSFPVEYL